MTAPDTAQPAAAPDTEAGPAEPAAAPRVDLYTGIHRAMRACMADTLTRVGCLDPQDPEELQDTLRRLDALLHLCRSHLEQENEHLHTAIEARRPGATQRMADDHADHVEVIAALQEQADRLRREPGELAALRLYRHLALFVAENFSHMHHEETAHNAQLWALYGDDELLGIEQRLIASVSPATRAIVMPWFLRALPPAQRAAMLRGMEAAMPPEAMRELLDMARELLPQPAWAKLARAMRVPAAPGLMTA